MCLVRRRSLVPPYPTPANDDAFACDCDCIEFGLRIRVRVWDAFDRIRYFYANERNKNVSTNFTMIANCLRLWLRLRNVFFFSSFAVAVRDSEPLKRRSFERSTQRFAHQLHHHLSSCVSLLLLLLLQLPIALCPSEMME